MLYLISITHVNIMVHTVQINMAITQMKITFLLRYLVQTDFVLHIKLSAEKQPYDYCH